MKNNIIKQISILFISVIVFTGCENSIEGINSNPLAATVIEPGLLFPEILVAGLSSTRSVEENAINMQAQQWSSIVGFGVFVNPERYSISPNTTNNIWVGHYTTGLRNLQQMRALTEANNPTALNIIGQAKLIEAFTYFNLTQIFGDIPFTEALLVADFPNPNFDSQEAVLRGIVTRIDEGLSALSTDTDIVEGGDLIYGGNRENWIRFGNSLKLRVLMLIANVDPGSVSAEIAAVANQPLIVENSQVAKLDFSDTAGNENPIWVTINNFNSAINGFWGAGAPLVDIMNANNDPRRATYFDDVDGAYVSSPQGAFSAAGVSAVSLNIIRPAMPDIYASAAETHFYLAEAILEGWATGDANASYQAGIQASMDFYDGIPGQISNLDKVAYMASLRGTILIDDKATALRKIHEEIYISNFTRGLAAWTNWRRNKVPDFEIPIGTALGPNSPENIIRRYQIPLSEVTSNPNAPTTLPALDAPMWFEK